ncbi:hypothetical protein MT418_005363 [Batrachochytrium dendrobatidis]
MSSKQDLLSWIIPGKKMQPVATFTCSSAGDQDDNDDASVVLDSDENTATLANFPDFSVKAEPSCLISESIPSNSVSDILATSALASQPNHGLLTSHGSSSALSIQSTTETIYYPRRLYSNEPILPAPLASIVSSISTISRVSIRIASVIAGVTFDSLKFGVSTSFDLGRRVMVSAASSARTLHSIAARHETVSADHGPFFNVLDKYTDTSIYIIHTAFSLAELLTLSTFHIASTTVNFSLQAAEEFVQTFDGLFGETDTSKTLAAFVCIFMEEWRGQDDALGLSTQIGKLSALGQISKAMLAYCCLQYVTRKRWRSLIELEPVFVGRAGKTKTYDPSNDFFTLNFFDTSGPLSCNPSPASYVPIQPISFLDEDMLFSKLPRRRSFSQHGLSTRASIPAALRMTNGSLSISTTPDLSGSNIPRRRCVSGPLGDASFMHGMTYSPDSIRFTPNESFFPYYSPCLTAQSNNMDLEASQKAFTDCSETSSLAKAVDTHYLLDEEPVLDPYIGTVSKLIPPEASKTTKLPISVVSDRSRVEFAFRYIKFATGAYGTNFLKLMGLGTSREHTYKTDGDHHNHQSLANHARIPVEHIVTSSFLTPNKTDPSKHQAPVHYVVVDHETKSVVVSLRGTLGISDLVTDLSASYLCYKTLQGLEGYVHSGMYKSAQLISKGPVRKAVIDTLEEHPGYALILTGHSLGAGCAALLSVIWSTRITHWNGQDDFVTNEAEGLPVRPIHCYVFGPPAIMSAELSRSYKSLISTFIFRNDAIPRLSLGLIRDFRNVTVTLCHDKGMAEKIIMQVLGMFKKNHTPAVLTGVDSESDELLHWATLKTLRADMKAEKLYPPGTIYWINANTGKLLAQPPHPLKPDTSHLPQPAGFPALPSPLPAPAPTPEPSKTTPISIHKVQDVEMAFSELAFSTKMFTDHSPHHYEGTLELLVRSMAASE